MPRTSANICRGPCTRCDTTHHSLEPSEAHVDHSPNQHKCAKCPYNGTSLEGLIGHSRVTGHAWVCRGCNEGNSALWEPNSTEYVNHLDEQNACSRCEKHFNTKQALFEHHRDSGHAPVCQACNDGEGENYDLFVDPYRRHVTVHHVCKLCEEHFPTDDELKMHQNLHLEMGEAVEECYGCYKIFASYTSMIEHLESGDCASGINVLDINRTAASNYKWREVIDQDCRAYMMGSEAIPHDELPYVCPTCGCCYRFLSALLEHVDSPDCEIKRDEGVIATLIDWLDHNHGMVEDD